MKTYCDFMYILNIFSYHFLLFRIGKIRLILCCSFKKNRFYGVESYMKLRTFGWIMFYSDHVLLGSFSVKFCDIVDTCNWHLAAIATFDTRHA